MRIGGCIHNVVLHIKDVVMELHLNSNILTRYVLNKCNDDEEAFMSKWVEESPVNRNTYNHMVVTLRPLINSVG